MTPSSLTVFHMKREGGKLSLQVPLCVRSAGVLGAGLLLFIPPPCFRAGALSRTSRLPSSSSPSLHPDLRVPPFHSVAIMPAVSLCTFQPPAQTRRRSGGNKGQPPKGAESACAPRRVWCAVYTGFHSIRQMCYYYFHFQTWHGGLSSLNNLPKSTYPRWH